MIPRFSRADLPKKVLVLASGALKIGEAGEFDYSGSQALKALRQEGIESILVNPNIATIQTSEHLCDKLYALPLDADVVEKVIAAERVDAILLSFGGQTALNCGLALERSGALARHNVRVLGTPTATIRDTEDRHLFNARLAEIGVKVARGEVASSVDEALKVAETIGLPVILRGAYALGGKGSSIVDRAQDLRPALERIFATGIDQVLIEQGLEGWKELELEIVRDARDNAICACTMENVDTLGVHTGDSIVVAPCQTLTNEEMQALRTIALKTVRHLGIVGECNIQFAVDTKRWDYRVIEVNARLSRSSALASKATGYPLAFVACMLCLGYALDDLKNDATKVTSAFFEPALDYVTCKVPRWDFEKFSGVDRRIGSEMRSVGEVMAIGRTFPEALQKALRMLDIGAKGLDPDRFAFDDVEHELRVASSRRIFAVARALRDGMGVERVAALSRIDPFFVAEMDEVARVYREPPADPIAVLRPLKELGFSDAQIGLFGKTDETTVRQARIVRGIEPALLQIDTLAAEYPASTGYAYLTYGATHDDLPLPGDGAVMILGSGPYRIGSSVEFDWCCVSAAEAARELGHKTIILNCNPETVSTDYDKSDLLIFDEISVETICALEHKAARLPGATSKMPFSVVVSMGGQLPNTLARKLADVGVPLLGTSAESLDRAEDRSKFSALCDTLDIDQPSWFATTDLRELDAKIESIGGYPVLVRPSYVLSGAAMSVVHRREYLEGVLQRATDVSPEHPLVVSHFESNARELEIDAVADNGEIVLWAVGEHIENAGVHSGDATLVVPPQRLYLETVRRAHAIAVKIARALEITGPFDVQFLARHGFVKVIECNLRASRSFPFVSKVVGNDFAREAMRRMLGARTPIDNRALDLDHVGVKAPYFSFGRLAGADPFVGVEMASTGEVACLGVTLHEALLRAMASVGVRRPKKGVLLSLGPSHDKYRFEEEARALASMGLRLFATTGTAQMLASEGIACIVVGRPAEEAFVDGAPARAAIDVIESGDVDLVINVPRSFDARGRPDGYDIRRRAVDIGVPLITDIDLARRFVQACAAISDDALAIRPWSDYLRGNENGRRSDRPSRA